MPEAAFNQSSFQGGEWSPDFQGNTVNPKYRTAMNVCLNGYPLEEGPWKRRSGFKFLGLSRSGQRARLYPWTPGSTLPLYVEFTDGYLRLWYGDDLVVEDETTITSISNASPAVITLSSDPGWATGDQIVLITTDYRLASFQPRVFQVVKQTTAQYALYDPQDGTEADGSLDGSTWASGIVASAARVVTFTTPYTSGAWYNNRIVQYDWQAFFFNGAYMPYVLTLTNANGRFSTFTWAEASPQDGPYFAPQSNQTATVTATSGTIAVTFSGGLGPNQGTLVSADVGRLVRLFSEPQAWVSTTTYPPGSYVSYANSYWIAQVTVSATVPGSDPTKWAITPYGAQWVWGKITSVTSSLVAQVALQNGPLLYTGTIYTWAMGQWGGQEGYPTNGTVYGQRLWMCQKRAIQASQPGTPFELAPTELDGTVIDSDAINYMLDTGDTEASWINWMVPDKAGIIAGSYANEWLINASVMSDPITPTTAQANKISAYGSANVDPAKTDLATIFVQRYRKHVLEMIADVFTGRYRAPDLALMARHLTAPKVEELAYMRESTPIVWARCWDGSLIGTTYRRISSFANDEPAMQGWHRHQLGSGRYVVSVITAPTPLDLVN